MILPLGFQSRFALLNEKAHKAQTTSSYIKGKIRKYAGFWALSTHIIFFPERATKKPKQASAYIRQQAYHNIQRKKPRRVMQCT